MRGPAEVDNRNAIWPVTIDPTFTQQEKLEAADAAAEDNFGHVGSHQRGDGCGRRPI
jgi:hypothetical protein